MLSQGVTVSVDEVDGFWVEPCDGNQGSTENRKAVLVDMVLLYFMEIVE